MISHYMLLTGLFFLALVKVALGTTEACLPAGEKKNGMIVNFYQYALKDSSTYSDSAYMAYGYADREKMGSVSGQTKLSIDYSIPCSTSSDDCPCSDDDSTEDSSSQVVAVKRGVRFCSDNETLSYANKKREDEDCDEGAAYWSSDLFGFYTTPTNVTVEMTGYFLPPKTGTYTFGFAIVDDSAILSVGGNVAFECCKQEQPPITSTDFTINGIKPWNADAPTNIRGSTYMYAGYYYPMKIVYSNAVSWGTLPISVTLPDGTEVRDDFEGYVYSFDDSIAQPHCSIPNPANHAKTCTSTATQVSTGSYAPSTDICTECTEAASSSSVGSTTASASSYASSTDVCTECTEAASSSSVGSTTASASSYASSTDVCTECTEAASSSSVGSSTDVCTECTETASSSSVGSTTASASSYASSTDVCTECTEAASSSSVGSTTASASSYASSTDVCTECTEAASSSSVGSTTASASSYASSTDVCTECTETASSSSVGSTTASASSYASSTDVCTECTEAASSSSVGSTTASASSVESSTDVCTECTETASSSSVGSTTASASSYASSTDVCTECTEAASASSVSYTSSSASVLQSTISVCTTCPETEISSVSIATSAISSKDTTTAPFSSFASTSNSATFSTQRDTILSFSLSSTISEYTNAARSYSGSATNSFTTSIESETSSFSASHAESATSASISSNRASLTSYFTPMHKITPIYPSNQTEIASSTVLTSVTSRSSASSESYIISHTATAPESKSSAINARATSTSMAPTNLITSAPTSFAGTATGLSTMSTGLTSSVSIPGAHPASRKPVLSSQQRVPGSSIVSSKMQESISSSLAKPNSFKSSESYRAPLTQSSGSVAKSLGDQIKSTSSFFSNTYEVSTTSNFISTSSEFLTSSTVSLSSTALATTRSSELDSQTEVKDSTRKLTSHGKASKTSTFVSTSKTYGILSGETSSGFYRDHTTMYRITSATPTAAEQTTLVTVTSCESNICYESDSLAIVSMTTTTVNGIATEYTTWCPISATSLTKETALESRVKTTLVTVTSCESDICYEATSPAVVSTATATVNGAVTEYTTWSPVFNTESKQRTTLVTVTSCKSGVCSETASPALVSTATATVNDVVTVFPTWSPQTTDETVSSNIIGSTSGTSTMSEAAETKTTVRSLLSKSDYAGTQATAATNVIEHSNSVISVSETTSAKSLTTSRLITVSQQSRSASPNGTPVSSTASLEISSYIGIANGLLANRSLSIFIASLLLVLF